MKKIVIKYGLISGLIMSVVMVSSMKLVDAIGAVHSEWLGYTTMLVSFLVVYFGVRSYRDTVLTGSISFGAAFKTGILISMITCLFYVGAWEVMYFGGMMPDFAKKYSETVIAKAKATGATQAELDKKTAEMQKFQEMYDNPFLNAGMTLLEPLPVALLVSLVSAGALSRKRRRTADEAGGMARAT